MVGTDLRVNPTDPAVNHRHLSADPKWTSRSANGCWNDRPKSVCASLRFGNRACMVEMTVQFLEPSESESYLRLTKVTGRRHPPKCS